MTIACFTQKKLQKGVNEMEELKNCPFCGGKASYVDYEGMCVIDGIVTAYASCYNPECLPKNIIVPIDSWQNRMKEEALQKQVEFWKECFDTKESVYAKLLSDYMALKAKLKHWKEVLG